MESVLPLCAKSRDLNTTNNLRSFEHTPVDYIDDLKEAIQFAFETYLSFYFTLHWCVDDKSFVVSRRFEW